MTKKLNVKNMTMNELTLRLSLWNFVLAYLTELLSFPKTAACICWGIDKFQNEHLIVANRHYLKHNYPEMWKYHPHVDRASAIYWWEETGLRGRNARIKIVNNIIRDLTAEIELREEIEASGFHLNLTEEKAAELRAIIADCYSKMPSYNSQGCSINHLVGEYYRGNESLTTDGAAQVGCINGPKLLKYMNEKTFNAIKAVDSEFAKLVKTDEGTMITAFIIKYSRSYQAPTYKRKLYGNGRDGSGSYGTDVPSIRYDSKQLTFKEFKEWQEKFYCARNG